MIDETQLQVTPPNSGSSLTISKASSRLIARGREDAEALVLAGSPTAIVALSAVVCETCGEHKELAAVDDDFCRWCRAREQKMEGIWRRWGFDRWGRPLDGIWGEEAQWRDSQAKSEIDGLLEHLVSSTRWIELRWGFGSAEYQPIRRGQAQAARVAETVNEIWGFDADGNPVGGSWDADTLSQATFALEEIKWILAHLGLPLPDDWPAAWSPQNPHALSALEISEAVWPIASRRTVCRKCGVYKQLIYAGGICAECGEHLS